MLDHPLAKAPTRGSDGAAGYDLYSVEDVTVSKSGSVSVGLRISIPEGYYGRVASRSGYSFKDDIEVGAGVIDADYTGLVRVKLYNHGSEPFRVIAGQKIAQLIITKISHPEVLLVESLDRTVRGDGGFGSTGEF